MTQWTHETAKARLDSDIAKARQLYEHRIQRLENPKPKRITGTKRQKATERRLHAFLLRRDENLTYAELGKRLGLSLTVARNLALEGERYAKG